jgi:hypothetical protein
MREERDKEIMEIGNGAREEQEERDIEGKIKEKDSEIMRKERNKESCSWLPTLHSEERIREERVKKGMREQNDTERNERKE